MSGVEERCETGSAMAEGRMVILLDILMPGMDGFGVLERMESLPSFGHVGHDGVHAERHAGPQKTWSAPRAIPLWRPCCPNRSMSTSSAAGRTRFPVDQRYLKSSPTSMFCSVS